MADVPRRNRPPTRTELYILYFAVLLLAVYVGLKLTDRQDRSDRTAKVAATAARDAKLAATATRKLAVDNADNAQVAAGLVLKVNGALCTFVGDLKDRAHESERAIAQTEQFLADGGSIPGIPPKVLRDSLTTRKTTLKNQRAAAASFRGLDCRPVAAKYTGPPGPI